MRNPASKFRLDGRTALVTGGGKGIGRAICLRFARAGASVVVVDLDEAAGRKTARDCGKATFVKADVSKADSIARMLKKAGAVDILVNNAGIAGRSANLEDLTEADWDAVMALNLRGIFLCCKAVLPGMKKRKTGCIVNIASVSGKEGNPKMIPYSASKAGVICLTKALAKEVLTDGIRVNCVAPAVIHTTILAQLTPQAIEYMKSKIPLGRTGDPDEVAAVVQFLAADESSFVTGQCYDVSGGRATY